MSRRDSQPGVQGRRGRPGREVAPRARPACLLLLLAGVLLTLALAGPPGAEAYVYWSNWGNGAGTSIGRAELDGSGVDQSFIGRYVGTGWSTSPSGPCGVAVNPSVAHPNVVYWANSTPGPFGSPGPAPWVGYVDVRNQPNYRIIGTGQSPCGVAVDDQGNIYWANGGLSGQGTTIGRMSNPVPPIPPLAARAGASARVTGRHAPGSGYGPLDPSFITGATQPCGVAVDGNYIYWANSSGTIGRANLNGSGVNQSFVSGAGLPCGVAVDDKYVYWSSLSGIVGRAELADPAARTTLISGAQGACGVAVDDQYVYWGTATGTTVGRANLDGSGVERSFITGASQPCGVAVHVPPNDFSLGQVDRNPRNGTAKLTVKVPGAGDLVSRGTRKLKRVRRRAPGAGKLRHPIRPRRRTKRRLRRRGKVTVRARIAYTPDGGRPNTRRRRVTLVRRRG